jgi:hypothetical protein
MRSSISDGVEIDQDDLIDMLAGMSSPKSETGAVKMIETISDGGIFTESDVIGGVDEATMVQIDEVRDRMSLLVRFRWLIWLLFVVPILLYIFMISDRWSSRFRLGGAVIALSALIAYLSITVAWSIAMDRVITPNIPSSTAFAESIRVTLPQTADELGSNGPINKGIEIVEAWQKRLKNQAVPWMFLGAIAFAFGTGWPSSGAAAKPKQEGEKSPQETDLPQADDDSNVDTDD